MCLEKPELFKYSKRERLSYAQRLDVHWGLFFPLRPQGIQMHLRKQMISERLQTSLCIKDTHPSSRWVRLWQAIHGNTPFAIMQLVFATILVTTFPDSSIPKSERFMNLFVVEVFLVTAESIIFWRHRRKQAEQIVFDMIAIAEKIEKISTEEQLSDMRLIAGLSKYLCKIYYCNMFGAIITYATFPFIQGSNLGKLPMLGDSNRSFWILYSTITVCFAVGPLSTISFLAYHLQVCLCLTGLFQTLNKQVETCVCSNKLTELVIAHQEVLRIAYIVRALFYRSCFFQIGGYVSIMIANTCLFTEERNPGVCFVVCMNISFIYFMCALSESVTLSNSKIGQAAYYSPWITADELFKKKLLFIMLKSTKAMYFKAGWIGKLRIRKFARAMKLWFQLVQALLNLT